MEMMDRISALSRLVNDILIYAGPKVPVKQPTPIQVLLEDSVKVASGDPQFDNVDVSISGDELDVPCDVGMLKPVFLNFLLNAAQAMEGEGKISIHVEARDQEGVCKIASWIPAPEFHRKCWNRSLILFSRPGPAEQVLAFQSRGESSSFMEELSRWNVPPRVAPAF